MMAFDREANPQPDAVPPPLGGDVAIVGMACLFAGAPDLDTYWKNILSKVDAVGDPPAGEWDPQVFYDPESQTNDRVYCKRGGYIGDLSQFRPIDYGVMPVTVDGGEPDQWLALRVAHEALADAGYTEPPQEHARTEVILGKGTYVNRGNLTVGYHGMIVEFFLQALRNLHPEYTEAEIGEIKKELKAGLPPFSADTAPALIGNIIAGRIANRLDLMGPSFTVDAACASALLAIEIGVSDLLSRKCDIVLAGGSNVNAPLPTLSLFCQLGALSRREQIRPFDKHADGTILGEGLGMIVLKRREDAERDRDRVYAIIKGVGLASDGRAVHVMAPRVEGEELALRRAYQMAGVTPRTIGLIEAHGTATPVGDVVEVQALGRVFGARQAPLPTVALGSVKSMIGHTMPAAGIAGVIKTALSLYHRVLPPTLNCEEPNPALHLENTPFYINTETRPWIHGAETPRRAGVNSFGFGGINAHVVLEEHPGEKPSGRSHQLHWETEVCILEAGSRRGLIERGGRLTKYLARAAEVPLKDLACTLNTRLEGQPARLAIIASSTSDLAQKLTAALGRLEDPKCRQIKDNSGVYFFEQPLEGKLAFLFPGEGAQYPNMLLDLCLHFPEVRRCFDLADRALTHASRRILPSDFIFPRSILSDAEQADVKKALWLIDGAVEAVLIGNWAIWTLLTHLEIRPDMIVGHSTGDYSAMVASSIIGIDDEGYIKTILEWNKAHRRLEKQIRVPEATLVAVAADAATVQSVADAVGGDLFLAMDNCPHQSVLVGSKIAAEKAIEQLRSRGIIYEILPFDRPYHTPLFQAYADRAGEEFFARLPIQGPKSPVYSCTTASPYPSHVAEIQRLFVAHWVRPVLFSETVKRLYEDGARLFVEAGPRGNLTAFVSDILRGKPHLAMPANVFRRSGITQINHLVGILVAQRVSMRLDYLYARRNPQNLPWEDAAPSVPARPKPEPMKLTLALPPLKLSPRPLKSASTPASAKHDGVAPSPPRHAGTGPIPAPHLRTAVALADHPDPASAALAATHPVPAPLVRPGPARDPAAATTPVIEAHAPTHPIPTPQLHDAAAILAERPESAHASAEADGFASPAHAPTHPIPTPQLRAAPGILGGRPESAYASAEADGFASPAHAATHPLAPHVRPGPTREPAFTGTSVAVMQEYFKGMEAFLDVETQVMSAFLSRSHTAKANGAASSAPARDFPLLGTITSLVPFEELTTVRQLSPEDDLFLHDHALGAPVSFTCPDLRPLTVVPLTLSMEMLAEAAAAMMPGKLLTGMRDIQARQWIQVDDTPVNLEISARRLTNSASEVFVQVRKNANPVIEGIMIFGDEYPAPPAPSRVPLHAERASRLASAELYDGRLMFHGPSFQAVAGVDRSGQNGIIARLRTLPTGNLFRSTPNPRFVTDPVVLDAAGQLVGFWAAEYLPRGFVVFPYHLEKLQIYRTNPIAGAELPCRVTLQLLRSEAIRSDIEIGGIDGKVWMQLEGWVDRRFDPPARFHRFWTAPREHRGKAPDRAPHQTMLSEPWRAPLAALPAAGAFECYRLEPLFEPGAALWKELWASLVLSRRERSHFAERREPEHLQLDWLSGRTAAKDAIRAFLRKRHGLELLPADVEIAEDEHGRVIGTGPWTRQLPVFPEVSLAHVEGMAVALVGDGSIGQHLGIDVQAMREPRPDLNGLALSAAENRLLSALPIAIRPEWLVRLSCAKKAAAQTPGPVRIQALHTETGIIEAASEASDERLLIYTAREGAYVAAIALYETRTS
jgi:acyl transferase domain-containing protein